MTIFIIQLLKLKNIKIEKKIITVKLKLTRLRIGIKITGELASMIHLAEISYS